MKKWLLVVLLCLIALAPLVYLWYNAQLVKPHGPVKVDVSNVDILSKSPESQSSSSSEEDQELALLRKKIEGQQAEIDALKKSQATRSSVGVYQFNRNPLTDHSGTQFGSPGSAGTRPMSMRRL